MVENEVFARKIILFDQLEKFGFIQTKQGYVYERNIYEGMTAKIIITDTGEVKGEVYDEDFKEPYVNFRVESATGAFVVGVRNAYRDLLCEIAAAVTTDKTYQYDQTNRIHEHILEKYGVAPEFLWKKFPHFGVYRNKESKKWFAIIMNIGRGKIFPGEQGEIEVMNVKLCERAEEFKQKGAKPCYHMNHQSWATVVFEDELSDDVIKEMIEVSFQNSKIKTKK